MAKAKAPGWKKRPAPRTAFKKGMPKPPNSGRKKGVQNKFTRDMKEAFLEAFNKLGGANWLYELGKRDRRAFAGLCRAMLPTQITGKDGAPIQLLTEKAVTGLEKLSSTEITQLQGIMSKLGLDNVEDQTKP